jgi:uncharacterized delta-60 repeat protein
MKGEETMSQKIERWVIGLFLCSQTVLAGMNSADGTFGENGKVLEMLSDNGKASFSTLLSLSKDKIIAGGNARNLDDINVMTLYRYTKNGKRDSTWGKNGLAQADFTCNEYEHCGNVVFSRGGDILNSLMQQSSGKIVAGAEMWNDSYSSDPHHGVFRLKTDGSIDTSYGVYRGYSYGMNYYMKKAVLQKDGKVITVGSYVDNPNPTRIALCRFNANGILDISFGTSGCTLLDTTPNDQKNEEPQDVLVQKDGKILIAGISEENHCGDEPDTIWPRGLLVRLDSNGSIDRDFGNNGIIKMTASTIFNPDNPCSGSYLVSLKKQKNGKIVVLGRASSFNPYLYFLARYTEDGTLDRNFGFNGMIAVFEGENYFKWEGPDTKKRSMYVSWKRVARQLQVLEDDSLVVSGEADEYWRTWEMHFFVTRFTTDGKVDWKYGSSGLAMASVNYVGDFLYGRAEAPTSTIQKSAQVLVGGWSAGYDTPKHAWLIRFKNSLRTKDYDGELGSDILWQRKNGKYLLWYMNQAGRKKASKLLGARSYEYKASGDFNGDGISDFLWQSKTDPNKHIVWYMKANHKKKARTFKTKKLVAVTAGDFNGDGISDILFRKRGTYLIWLMGVKGRIAVRQLGNTNETIVATGDFNGDYITDVLVKVARGENKGQYALWTMDRNGTIADRSLKGWEEKKIQGAGDFDGDGRDDILWKLPDGSHEIWTEVWDHEYENIGANTLKVLSVADYNGDGFADILWKRKNGKHLLWLMSPWPGGNLHKYRTVNLGMSQLKVRN